MVCKPDAGDGIQSACRVHVHAEMYVRACMRVLSSRRPDTCLISLHLPIGHVAGHVLARWQEQEPIASWTAASGGTSSAHARVPHAINDTDAVLAMLYISW